MARSQPTLSTHQHRSAGNGKPAGRRFELGRIDPQAKPSSSGSKARDKALKPQKMITPVNTSSVSAANILGVSVRKLASRMREASPVSRPAAPATISAVTAPIRLRPPEIFSPATK